MRIRNPFKDKGKKIVLIIGGGFGGLNAARSLADQPEVHVVLIDQHNHHLFQPLLYQVATAALNPGNIAVPIRSRFKGIENISVHMGRVSGVHLAEKFVSVDEFEIEYDYLIVACGAQHSYFDHPEWEEHAPGLKTLEQATEIRHRVLSAFEHAENEIDEEKKKALLTFVVVGGGPTGVELAGAIADISRTVLKDDFRRIDPTQACVILIEAGARVLSSFDEDLSEKARKDLIEIGVQVRTQTRVQNIDAQGVTVPGEFIPAKSVFWAAGVQAARLNFTPPLEADRAGRVKVGKDFTIPQDKNVFVIGDMASYEYEPGKFLPGLAPVALQSGVHVGEMIVDDCHGLQRKPFKYFDKGQMATIGKYKAIAQTGKLKMSGRLAWLAWLFIHVLYLLDSKNRIAVVFLWAWSYIFAKRGSRLIFERDWKLKP